LPSELGNPHSFVTERQQKRHFGIAARALTNTLQSGSSQTNKAPQINRGGHRPKLGRADGRSSLSVIPQLRSYRRGTSGQIQGLVPMAFQARWLKFNASRFRHRQQFGNAFLPAGNPLVIRDCEQYVRGPPSITSSGIPLAGSTSVGGLKFNPSSPGECITPGKINTLENPFT
jgi:hypothetical protein